jgi:hypothetical protein
MHQAMSSTTGHSDFPSAINFSTVTPNADSLLTSTTLSTITAGATEQG